jgi:PAS domain S-box-containing protein
VNSSSSYKIQQFQRLLEEAVLLPLVVALGVVGLFLWQNERLRSAFDWVERSQQILTEVTGTEKMIIDAETGMRGFLLNGNEEFLDPFNFAVEKLPTHWNKLAEFVVGDSEQSAKVAQAHSNFDDWLKVARGAIGQRRTGSFADDAALDTKAKKIMDVSRDQFQAIVQREKTERILRDEKAHQNVVAARWGGLCLIIILALILAFRTRSNLHTLKGAYETGLKAIEKRAQELYESREWFSTTLQSIGDAVIVVDTESRIELLNPLAQKLTGWKSEDALMRPMNQVFKIIDQTTRLPSSDAVARVFSEGVIVGLAKNSVLISKSGREYLVEDSAAPVRNKEGRIIGVVLVFRDVTERHRTESALIESEFRFRRVANAAPAMVWTTDTKKQCDWFNDGWLQFTGRPLTDDLGKGWLVCVHPDDRVAAQATSSACFDAQQPFEIEYRLRRFDGVYRWVVDRGVPRFHADKTFIGYIGCCVDVTENREARDQLEKSAIDLQKAICTRDEFLSVASHELKTPLTSLKLHLQITLRAMSKGQSNIPKISQTLNRCLDQVNRIAALVEDLLDVSRIESGRLVYTFEPTDLSALVHSAVECLTEQFHAARSVITVDAAEPVIAVCDRFRIDQVIINLLTNSIKYGGAEPVLISVKADANFAAITVNDNGIGIPEDNKHLIFERFERAKNSQSISGLGLGLFIVRQIIRAHSGTIQVKSTVGKGSTFTVKIPFQQMNENGLSHEVELG